MSGVIGLLAASGAVSSLVSPAVGRLVDLIPDPEKRAEEAANAASALMAADQAIASQQNAINLKEAGNESLFVSGWRPFIGWSCGAALLWQVLLAPFVKFNLAAIGYHPTLPELDSSWISAILIPMLGLGTMRTVEKLQGVAGSLMGQPRLPSAPPPPASPAPSEPPPPRPALPAAPARDAATVDVMARTLWGEARSEGRIGMEAVAAVIRRRAQYPRWWGSDIRSVCLAPYQFSCWLPADPNRPKLQAVTGDDDEFRMALAIADQAMAGSLDDPTNDADSYANLSVVHPRWADAARQTAVIGRHTFFRLET